jgi:hypothetical protein
MTRRADGLKPVNLTNKTGCSTYHNLYVSIDFDARMAINSPEVVATQQPPLLDLPARQDPAQEATPSGPSWQCQCVTALPPTRFAVSLPRRAPGLRLALPC